MRCPQCGWLICAPWCPTWWGDVRVVPFVLLSACGPAPEPEHVRPPPHERLVTTGTWRSTIGLEPGDIFIAVRTSRSTYRPYTAAQVQGEIGREACCALAAVGRDWRATESCGCLGGEQ